MSRPFFPNNLPKELQTRLVNAAVRFCSEHSQTSFDELVTAAVTSGCYVESEAQAKLETVMHWPCGHVTFETSTLNVTACCACGAKNPRPRIGS